LAEKNDKLLAEEIIGKTIEYGTNLAGMASMQTAAAYMM